MQYNYTKNIMLCLYKMQQMTFFDMTYVYIVLLRQKSQLFPKPDNGAIEVEGVRLQIACKLHGCKATMRLAPTSKT